jgi:hypothetical protein
VRFTLSKVHCTYQRDIVSLWVAERIPEHAVISVSFDLTLKSPWSSTSRRSVGGLRSYPYSRCYSISCRSVGNFRFQAIKSLMRSFSSLCVTSSLTEEGPSIYRHFPGWLSFVSEPYFAKARYFKACRSGLYNCVMCAHGWAIPRPNFLESCCEHLQCSS